MSFQPYANADALLAQLAHLLNHRDPLGFDVEGYPHTGITDFSFATTPEEALWIPIKKGNGQPWWTPAETHAIMEASRLILESPDVPKVCHNGLYEAFCLAWGHNITLRGLVDDSMLLWHELFAELEKALEVASSLLTRQPYWKHGRIAVDENERAFYNCTDSCVTLEICQIMKGVDPDGAPFLTPRQLEHYRFNMELLEPCLWQMRKGLNYDKATARAMATEYAFNLYAFQGELDRLAGIGVPGFDTVRDIVCLKKRWSDVTNWGAIPEYAKPSWLEAI